jgi:hypothetical protein
MKIVHTFVRQGMGYYPEYRELMDTWRLKGMILSCILARKHYDEVELWTSKEIAELIQKLGLPYTKINVHGKEAISNAVLFGLPKLYTFLEQTEPFVHIDVDTFLFDRLNESRLTDITFCHQDVVINKLSSIKTYYEIYVESLLENQDKLPEWYGSNIDINEIPNMNLVAIKSINEFKEAVQLILSIYLQNKEHWDKLTYNGSMIMEQLGTGTCLKHLNHRFDYYFDNHIPNMSIKNNFMAFFNPYTKKQQLFNTDTQMNEIDNFNYDGYLHTSGYWLSNPLTQKIIESRIVKEGYGDLLSLVDSANVYKNYLKYI